MGAETMAVSGVAGDRVAEDAVGWLNQYVVNAIAVVGTRMPIEVHRCLNEKGDLDECFIFRGLLKKGGR